MCFLDLSKILAVFAAKSCISLLHLPSQLWSEQHRPYTRSISWAYTDLSNVVMNASMSSDDVSLVNFSESTPNSVLSLWCSRSAKEAVNVLIISSDLRALSSIRLHSSSFRRHSSYCLLSSSQQTSSFCCSSSRLRHSSSQSSMNLLSSDGGNSVFPWFFPNVTAYGNQVAAGPLANSQCSDPIPDTNCRRDRIESSCTHSLFKPGARRPQASARLVS